MILYGIGGITVYDIGDMVVCAFGGIGGMTVCGIGGMTVLVGTGKQQFSTHDLLLQNNSERSSVCRNNRRKTSTEHKQTHGRTGSQYQPYSSQKHR